MDILKEQMNDFNYLIILKCSRNIIIKAESSNRTTHFVIDNDWNERSISLKLELYLNDFFPDL